MRLRTRYVIFTVLVLVIFFLLSLQLLPEHKIWFLITELLIVTATFFSINLYQALIRPVNLISSGIEMLKDRDFNTQLAEVGQVEMDQLITVYNRMIEQLRTERIRQREQHFFLERLIEASPIGVIILDFDGRVAEMNPRSRELLGVVTDEYQGSKLADLTSDLAVELESLKAGEARIVKLSSTAAYKCRKSQFRDRGFYHHFILIEELTEEIHRTEKQAYGKIIRLMSHEINNSIGAVNSMLDSFRYYQTFLPEKDRADFKNAVAVAIERNQSLSKFMSSYAEVVRLPLPVRRQTDLHQVLKSVATLVRSECRERKIEWCWNLIDEKMVISIDAQQFEQVLLNIVRNAIEAIENGGTITVETVPLPTKRLFIRDTGNGFAGDVQGQLFTPFFSTKKNGQGIGLTLVREILMNHGFRFELKRRDSQYTEFIIDFG